jgi:hypothetical protein
MTPARLIAICSLSVAALAAGGCTNPYDKPATSATTSTAGAPPATSTVAAAKPSVAAAVAAPSADQAIRQFTTTFINWKFNTLPAVKRQLAAQATGKLHTQLLKEADQALTEVSRRESNQSNKGNVEVVADPKRTGRYFVVTHETAQLGNADGQPGYFVYTASAARIDSGFRVTDFAAAN